MNTRVHTKPECTCGTKGQPFWHDMHCPVWLGRCSECDGMGGRWVTLSCECCSDFNDCDYCNNTGMAPGSDETQSTGEK